MKTQQKMLIAFILNLCFSLFELFGGIISKSSAILTDAVHDMGDATALGASLLFERKSQEQCDEIYTYGYGRFSLIGALFSTTMLIIGSIAALLNATEKIMNPVETDYKKMIVFAIVGIIVNAAAAFLTHGKNTENQRAINLHMLEDVLGWFCVLVGGILIYFTNLSIIDPLMSIGISLFIMFHAFDNVKEIFNVFLEKVPDYTSVSEIRGHLMKIEGVTDVHHIHIWSFVKGTYASTMHIVTSNPPSEIKKKVRAELQEHGISHVTLELETTDEVCSIKDCVMSCTDTNSHHHHH